jgi:hypothetical protein
MLKIELVWLLGRLRSTLMIMSTACLVAVRHLKGELGSNDLAKIYRSNLIIQGTSGVPGYCEAPVHLQLLPPFQRGREDPRVNLVA